MLLIGAAPLVPRETGSGRTCRHRGSCRGSWTGCTSFLSNGSSTRRHTGEGDTAEECQRQDIPEDHGYLRRLRAPPLRVLWTPRRSQGPWAAAARVDSAAACWDSGIRAAAGQTRCLALRVPEPALRWWFEPKGTTACVHHVKVHNSVPMPALREKSKKKV
jgi:hypothetical protein